MWRVISLAACVLFLTANAFADEPPMPMPTRGLISGSVSGGYAHLIGHADPEAFPHDSFYVDMQLMYRPAALRVPVVDAPVWIGIGSCVSSYGNSHGVDGTVGGVQVDDATLDSYFSDISFEGRVDVPIRFGGDKGFFVMPTLGAGLLVNTYSHKSLDIDGDVEGPTDHTGPAFCLRPGVAFGYSWDKFSIGAEVSYEMAWGDFGRYGGALQEIHTGAFLSFVY